MKKLNGIWFCLLLVYTAAVAQTKIPQKSEATIYSELLQYANTLKVIDAHEHLLSADDHSKSYLSFWNFLSDYVKWDLMSAGLPKSYEGYMPKNEREVIELFNVLEPYLPYVEHGSYMLSVKMALKKYFGYEKITRANFLDITRRLNKENTVGNYHKVLKDAHIVKLLEQSVQGNPHEFEFVNLTTLNWQWETQQKVTKMCRENKAMTLDDVIAFYETELTKEKQNGSVGIKFFPHVFIEPYDTVVAGQQFEAVKNGTDFNQRSTLARVIYEKQIEIGTKLKMVIAIHTGVWADITDKTPLILFPIVAKYPNATFDIYHMGIPEIREAAFLGKNYSNVYLNLCWAYSVSENMVLNSLDEWIDLVPTNKIIGFGGDVITLPQHAVGMLIVAKHVLCKTLAKRIANERMDTQGAKKILEDWLYNNPARVYGIK
ncbi:MAG: amidohydrolase family protein [Gloeobacteraceae cyanobacterium ES-bin-316]|nr:amidohydrolase family protein [Ferruginibacter sp.]